MLSAILSSSLKFQPVELLPSMSDLKLSSRSRRPEAESRSPLMKAPSRPSFQLANCPVLEFFQISSYWLPDLEDVTAKASQPEPGLVLEAGWPLMVMGMDGELSLMMMYWSATVERLTPLIVLMGSDILLFLSLRCNDALRILSCPTADSAWAAICCIASANFSSWLNEWIVWSSSWNAVRVAWVSSIRDPMAIWRPARALSPGLAGEPIFCMASKRSALAVSSSLRASSSFSISLLICSAASIANSGTSDASSDAAPIVSVASQTASIAEISLLGSSTTSPVSSKRTSTNFSANSTFEVAALNSALAFCSADLVEFSSAFR